MANQPEVDTYDAGVYQLETTDPVLGGVGGVANAPLLNLANRTGWLKNTIGSILSTIASLAPINSAGLTGTPTAPTAAAGDDSTSIATTAFVQGALGGDAVVTVPAGATTVTLTPAQYGCGTITVVGALTANVAIVFPSSTGKWIVANNTSGSFSVTCRTVAGAVICTVLQARFAWLWGDGTNIFPVNNYPPSGKQTFTAVGAFNFTVPAGVYRIDVEGVGGGGAGGSTAASTTSAQVSAPGGGNAGCYFQGSIVVTPGQVISGTIGAGGVSSLTQSSVTNGTQTTFGTITAPGGQSGINAPANPPPLVQAAPAPASVTTGADLNGSEVSGYPGIAGTIANVLGGKGADGPWGGGGAGAQNLNGGNATCAGAGGGGAGILASSTGKLGGLGATGRVTVRWGFQQV